MKLALILGGIVATLIVVGYSLPSEMHVQNPTATNTPEVIEVLPEWANDPDAKAAAEAVIRNKELEAEEAALVEEITALQTELDEVRKELNVY